MKAGEPKGAECPTQDREGFADPTHLESLGKGLLLGALGGLPALLPGCDTFALLAWIALIAPAAGAFLGAQRVDPLRFGAVAPAMWAVALAILGAAEATPSLPSPALGALAWTGLFFLGMGAGSLARSAGASAAILLLLAALLVALPGRAGILGKPWPPRAASVLLDLSPFVLLGECSGVRDMAWHRSMYASVGTDRFQRTPWSAPWTGGGVLALGLCFAWFARRRTRAAASPSGAGACDGGPPSLG